jgi:hypothetical protein
MRDVVACSYSSKPLNFMELKDSLTCSQELASDMCLKIKETGRGGLYVCFLSGTNIIYI